MPIGSQGDSSVTFSLLKCPYTILDEKYIKCSTLFFEASRAFRVFAYYGQKYDKDLCSIYSHGKPLLIELQFQALLLRTIYIKHGNLVHLEHIKVSAPRGVELVCGEGYLDIICH